MAIAEQPIFERGRVASSPFFLFSFCFTRTNAKSQGTFGVFLEY